MPVRVLTVSGAAGEKEIAWHSRSPLFLMRVHSFAAHNAVSPAGESPAMGGRADANVAKVKPTMKASS
jgi:hypothetical protein